jgi:WD40 repeat protein
MTYTNQKSAIISIVLNSSKDKLVSCGLDSTIYVWNIVRNANRVVQIEVINMIKNNFPICALNTCYFANNIVYIGTKDGKIKIYNIQSNSF